MRKEQSDDVHHLIDCAACGARLCDAVALAGTTLKSPVILVVRCWKCGDTSVPVEMTTRYGVAPATVRDPREVDGLRQVTSFRSRRLKDGRDLIETVEATRDL